MATCIVSGTILDPTETPVNGAAVSFRIQNPTLDSLSVLGPVNGSTTTDASGNWSLTIARNISGIVTIMCASDNVSDMNSYNFSVNIPNAATASFSSVWSGN